VWVQLGDPGHIALAARMKERDLLDIQTHIMTVQEFWKKDAEPTQTYFLTPPEQKVMQV
jgi:hypothetical protein